MTVLSVLDAAGRRRSPATLPGYHAGRPPRNKGMRYPADAPTVDEIVAVMRHTADDRHGWRVRAMIVVLWRAGLRIQEALALAQHDLDHRRGSILVPSGKGGRSRVDDTDVMDDLDVATDVATSTPAWTRGVRSAGGASARDRRWPSSRSAGHVGLSTTSPAYDPPPSTGSTESRLPGTVRARLRTGLDGLTRRRRTSVSDGASCTPIEQP
jgi:integrase